jgi:hypothetical protein
MYKKSMHVVLVLLYGLTNFLCCASSNSWTAVLQCSLAAFAPCPPPRFDVFSEKLICSWTTAQDEALSVEEVMRSCGGAVQGIRELPLFRDDVVDDGIYLNRANDGFVFYDHGWYTFGPSHWKDSDNYFLSNFMFGKARLVVSSEMELTSTDSAARNPTRKYLRKTFGGSDLAQPSIEFLDANPTSISVDFGRKIRCSMPSPGQPWMLQRAKWEQEAVKKGDDDDNGPGDDRDQSDSDSIGCWVIAQPASEFFEWVGSSEPTTEGKVVHMGALCEGTGIVKTLARHYNPDGGLEGIEFLEGSLRR